MIFDFGNCEPRQRYFGKWWGLDEIALGRISKLAQGQLGSNFEVKHHLHRKIILSDKIIIVKVVFLFVVMIQIFLLFQHRVLSFTILSYAGYSLLLRTGVFWFFYLEGSIIKNIQKFKKQSINSHVYPFASFCPRDYTCQFLFVSQQRISSFCQQIEIYCTKFQDLGMNWSSNLRQTNQTISLIIFFGGELRLDQKNDSNNKKSKIFKKYSPSIAFPDDFHSLKLNLNLVNN